jgi:Xaa-Pro aminopeptidase
VVSQTELARRQTALQTAMDVHGYDALLIAGNAESMQRGYLRYVSDWRVWMGSAYAVVPHGGETRLFIGPGSQGYWAEQAGWPRGPQLAPDRLHDIAEMLRRAAGGNGRVGIVGLGQIMPYRDAVLIVDALDGVTIEDATSVMDRLMMIKSPEEIASAAEGYKHVAAALRRIGEVLTPGQTEREVIAAAIHELAAAGCLDGIAHLTTGQPPYIRPPTERRIGVDEIVKIQLEYAGPGGYWVELSSIFSFREPPPSLQRHVATIDRAMRRAADVMRPGVNGATVIAAIQETYREDGWRVSGKAPGSYHGIGLNIIEPPFGSDATNDVFEANMIIMLGASASVEMHPWSVFLPDNYVVTEQGGVALGDHPRIWHVLAGR